MYDPRVGRWLSEDPIGFAGGDTNLSRYVGNSPTNYTDPSGLSSKPSGTVKPATALQHCGENRIGYFVGVFADYEDDWDAGSAMSLQGHAAIGFIQGHGNGIASPPEVFGFWPGDEVQDDGGKGFKVGRIYRVSQNTYLRMMAAALRRRQNPGQYDKIKNNCTTFVKEIGDKGGLLNGVNPQALSPYESYANFNKSNQPTYVPGALGEFLQGDERADSFLYPHEFSVE